MGTHETRERQSWEKPHVHEYSFSNGPGPMGRHGHGPKKHDTSPARPARHRARAWHGPQPCPCLGRTFGPWASTRHGTKKGLARHRHGFEPSWPLDPPTPAILAVGFRRWGGGVYKQRRRPAPPRTPNPKSFSPSPAALSSRSLWLSSPIPTARDDSDGRRRPAAVPTSSSRPTAAPGLRRCR